MSRAHFRLRSTLLAMGLASVASAQCTPAKLAASDGASNDHFGAAAAVCGDTAVLGVPYDDDSGESSGSAFIFENRGGAWVQVAKLTASDGAAGDEFGSSVSLSGDTAIVGSHLDDDRGSNSGSAYVFERVGGVWLQVAKLTPSDGASGDLFGSSVSISGETAVIGAQYQDSLGRDAGSAYVFERVGGVWMQVAKLTASDGAAYEEFGCSVSLDGDTAVVGAYLDTALGSESGSAYVFDRVGGIWTQVAKLTRSHGGTNDWFGSCVSVNGDTAVIGSPMNWSGIGSACVFERSGGVWTQVAKLDPIEATDDTVFGRCVAISGDTAVVQRLEQSSGSACMFEKIGGVWQQTRTLTVTGRHGSFADSLSISGDDVLVGDPVSANSGYPGSAYMFDLACLCVPEKILTSDGASGDLFGTSVSVSGDAALVAAPDDDDLGDQSGSAYVFERVGGLWGQLQKVTASDGAAGDRFGRAVSLDGDTAVIGAVDYLGTKPGSAYVFENVAGAWMQVAKLTASDGEPGDHFGGAVCLSGDAAIVGAENIRSAYVFERLDGEWIQTAKLTATDGAWIGASVTIGSDTALVGAPGDGYGSIFVFERSGDAWTQVAKLTPAPPASELFGCSISVSGDAAFVGAEGHDYYDGGQAYVFERVGGVWSQVAKFDHGTKPEGNYFGCSVSVSGNRAVVGSQGDDPLGAWSGSAYLYERVGGGWTEAAKLTAPDGSMDDAFGCSVAVDGDNVLAGARWDDDLGRDSGSAYAFNLVCICPVDINGDGDIDTRDLLAFLNAWVFGAGLADWDQNGTIDTRDVLAFLNDWTAGC